ncbi:MAG TPA: MBL fold metallo-hydrolase [Syntrophomonadaceae bacterium]|nr:MBL fold metallo-hydrolase [Syntrophomonadaceae bacterium]
MKRLSEHVLCLGNRHFNFFVVGKSRAALVECGVSGAVAGLRKQWEEHGHPSLPHVEHLLAMHAHFDHVCGIPSLQELFPGAALTASPKAQKVLGKAAILADFFNQDKSMLAVLTNEGLLEANVEISQVDHIDVERTVQEGDHIVPEAGVVLEIISAPGHSSDSLAAYLPSDRVMFISDAAGFQSSDTEIFPIFFQSYPLYIETIERLRGYPSRVLAIPHERIWTGNEIDAFYQRALLAAREAFTRIRDMYDAGIPGEEMRERLFQNYYRGDLRIYTPGNIRTCVDLLVRRVQECL